MNVGDGRTYEKEQNGDDRQPCTRCRIIDAVEVGDIPGMTQDDQSKERDYIRSHCFGNDQSDAFKDGMQHVVAQTLVVDFFFPL